MGGSQSEFRAAISLTKTANRSPTKSSIVLPSVMELSNTTDSFWRGQNNSCGAP